MSEDKQEDLNLPQRTDSTSDAPLVSFYKKNKIRSRGRPKKITVMPKSEKARAKMKEKKRFLENHDLLEQVRQNPNSLDVVDTLMENLALEAASLEFERKDAERKNEDTTDLSSKKVTAIRSMMDLFEKKRDAVIEETFDFQSERFERLMEFIFQKVHLAAQNANLTEEQIDVLFGNLEDLFDEESGWEDEARDFIKQA